MRRWFWTWVSVLFVACSSTKTINPKALLSLQEQQQQGLAIPATKPLPSVLSQIDVPVSVDLKPYFELANNSIDKHMAGGESPCQGVRYQYRLDRGNLNFVGLNQTLTTSVQVAYGLKGQYCAACFMGSCALPIIPFSCGWEEARRQATLTLQSQLSISPDYRVVSKTTVQELKALNPCKVSFGIDITDKLMNTVAPLMGELCSEVDSQVYALSFKAEVQDLWNTLAEPMQIDYVGELRLQPRAVSVSTINLNGTTLQFNAGISAQPIISSIGGPKNPSPVPNLSPYKSGSGFRVYTDLKLDYDSLSCQILTYMKGEKFGYKKDSVELSSLRLFPTYQDSQTRLGIRVDVIGTKSGSLYLVGDPVFDNATRIVRLTNVDYDLQSKNVLLKSASWLLDETVRQNLEENLWFDVGDLFTLTEESVNEALNQRYENGAQSKGGVQHIELTDYQLRPQHLLLRTHIKGQLSISM
ncbi:MAG: DUF4403 family protein [Bacteroidetes bacterium]|nr:DUF4403 family protein [Bacteroidota bacterium]